MRVASASPASSACTRHFGLRGAGDLGDLHRRVEAGAGEIQRARPAAFDVPMKSISAHYLDTADRDLRQRACARDNRRIRRGLRRSGIAVSWCASWSASVAAITPYESIRTSSQSSESRAGAAHGQYGHPRRSPYTPFSSGARAGGGSPRGRWLYKGVFNVITGGTARWRGAHLDSGASTFISFTGSDAVGSAIAAQGAPTLKRLVLELGGKSALIVRHDANVPMALAQALRGFTSHAGQGCAMNTRSAGPQLSARGCFVKQLAQAARAAKRAIRPIPRHGTGPPIRSGARDRVERYVALGLESGAKLRAGGSGVRPRSGEALHFRGRLCSMAPDPGCGDCSGRDLRAGGRRSASMHDEEAVALANRSRFRPTRRHRQRRCGTRLQRWRCASARAG